MNGAHWHLVLNHAPLFGILTGSLLLAFGLFYNSDPIKKAALSVFIISALVVIPVYLTGDPAEHVLKNSLGITIDKHLIHEHEEAAGKVIWGVIALGLLSIYILYAESKIKNNISKLYSIALIISVIILIGIATVNNKGGLIRHSEMNTTSAVTSGEKDSD